MNKPKQLLIVLSCTLLSCTAVAILFLISEQRMHHSNPFIRRFQQGTMKDRNINLGYNSYYYAGADQTAIYLGNTTAPLTVSILDQDLKTMTQSMVHFEQNYSYGQLQLRILGHNFYLVDGMRPAIYSGRKNNWKASLKWKGNATFSQPQLIDSLNLLCRTIDPKNSESELATLYFGSNPSFKIGPELLEKQIDGNFDSDGRLVYDSTNRRAVYTYLYRNQYITATPDLKSILRGRTIDTVSRANIHIAYVKQHEVRKFSAPPVEVNKSSAISRNLLFINSGQVGRFEEKRMWDQASVIDVYNLTDNSYLSSFYIYNVDNRRLGDFFVSGSHLYGFIGKHLVRYRLSKAIQSNYTS